MQPPQNYLSDDILENSPVVANCAMNRKRGLRGVNSYEKDLGLDIQELCLNALRQRGCFSWLDICCGEANALYDLSDAFPQNAGKVQLVGIDLVGTFAPERSDTRVSIIEGSFLKWEPNDTFDLITCVHGLHYMGDKLKAIDKALSLLNQEGQFHGHFDLNECVLKNGTMCNLLKEHLRKSSLKYNSRKRILTGFFPSRLQHPWTYLGASDEAGPNYTGQPSVAAYYSSSNE
tara:strand:- start:131 stop:826 length:696 start_codon:yes stop_codon:yes gene_type:complete